MGFSPFGEGEMNRSEQQLVHAIIQAICLMETASPNVSGVASLVSPDGLVRIWYEPAQDKLSCFAIEVRRSRNDAWQDPLK
jgi:hypothetical protein